MPPAEFQVPPDRLCVLRLSAIGDVCHALPVVRTIQDAWPSTSITWILGRVEHKLIGHLPDVDFVVFDKRAGIQGYRDLRRKLAGRRYDVLLHMQLALRASAASALVPARVRLGYDRARAREGQWLFTNRRIAARSNQHVLDGMFGFAEALGLATRSMRWNIPLGDDALGQKALLEQLKARREVEVMSSPTITARDSERAGIGLTSDDRPDAVTFDVVSHVQPDGQIDLNLVGGVEKGPVAGSRDGTAKRDPGTTKAL